MRGILGDMPGLVHVVGARPNFIKAAPVVAALADAGVAQRLVHTGQHYDAAMSDVFFEELGLPTPDHNLGVGSGSHAAQTAALLVALEEAFMALRPARVVVYGDVNSTLAATIAQHAAEQDADRAEVREALTRPEIRDIAGRMGVDVDRAAAAVDTLAGAELVRAAGAARQINQQLVGGQRSITITTTTIIIALLIVILIIAFVYCTDRFGFEPIQRRLQRHYGGR